MKHTLRSKGAAFKSDGWRIDDSTTAGVGHAICSCGQVSPELPSGKQRVAWHKEHKATVEAAENGSLPAEEPKPSPSTKKFDIAAMKDKIAKLLAKAEGSDNEKEQRAFTEKAEELMLQLGINAAELEAAGEVKPEKIVEEHRDFPGNYSIVMVPFATDIAAGFGGLQVLTANFYGRLDRRVYVIGHKSDVETFLQLLDSLTIQVRTALRQWQKEHIEERRYLTDMQKYTQHRSFISGYGQTVRRRLSQLRTKVEKTASTGAELVLVDKKTRVKEYLNEQYPNLKTINSSMQHSLAGMIAGRDAGERADIGQSSVKDKNKKEVNA